MFVLRLVIIFIILIPNCLSSLSQIYSKTGSQMLAPLSVNVQQSSPYFSSACPSSSFSLFSCHFFSCSLLLFPSVLSSLQPPSHSVSFSFSVPMYYVLPSLSSTQSIYSCHSGYPQHYLVHVSSVPQHILAFLWIYYRSGVCNFCFVYFDDNVQPLLPSQLH